MEIHSICGMKIRSHCYDRDMSQSHPVWFGWEFPFSLQPLELSIQITLCMIQFVSSMGMVSCYNDILASLLRLTTLTTAISACPTVMWILTVSAALLSYGYCRFLPALLSYGYCRFLPALLSGGYCLFSRASPYHFALTLTTEVTLKIVLSR